jgi:spore coat protein U-like protein
MNNKLFAASALAVTLFAQPALAASEPENLVVSVIVEASCTITTSPLNFGTIGTLTTGGADITAAGAVNVICTSDAPYEIALGNGENFATTRHLLNQDATNDTLSYTLFSDTGRLVAWGSTLGSEGNAVSGTGTNEEVSHPVYGSIASGQAVSLGTYTDTVIATVWY